MNSLPVHSCHHLARDPLLVQRPQHAVPPILPPLQVDHEHLRGATAARQTSDGPPGRSVQPEETDSVFTHLVEAHLVGLLSGDADVLGGHHGGVSHYRVGEKTDAANGAVERQTRKLEETDR